MSTHTPPSTGPILPTLPTQDGEDDSRQKVATILWRHLESSGRDACDLWRHSDGWTLTGTSIFRDGERIAHLRYAVECDAAWITRAGFVQGSLDDRAVNLTITADPERRWSINGRPAPDVTGCVDLDLNFTPSTNLIQLRRLALPVRARAEAPAAWLAFPEFTLQKLPQTYARASVPCYDYSAPTVGYSGLLQVHELGFVLEYPRLWTAEALFVLEK